MTLPLKIGLSCRRLGLPVCSSARFVRELCTTPRVGAYSLHVVPPPSDWPAPAHVTGYFWFDTVDRWQPPAALQAFLEAGDPPVYVEFGSMAGRDPDQMASLVLEALALSSQRGLPVTGWGGLRAWAVPSNVFVLDAAPHAWLFPHTAEVVTMTGPVRPPRD